MKTEAVGHKEVHYADQKQESKWSPAPSLKASFLQVYIIHTHYTIDATHNNASAHQERTSACALT